MTRNLRLFLGATFIFYVIGAVNDAAGMYVLAAASLAVVLACFFLTRLLIRGLEPEIELHGTRTRAGKDLSATIRLHNAGAITRTQMSLALRMANETVPEGSRDYEFLLPALPPRSRTDVDVSLACVARGLHRLTDFRLVANDPIGVYHRAKRFDDAGTFLALPQIHEASGLSSWELLSPEGRRSSRILRRSGGESQGIRAHTPGDDLRHVHWKVSAHIGELVVKQHRQRREAEVSIWLDLWDRNHVHHGADSPMEVAISLTATLLDIFVHGDYLVSVAAHGLPPDLTLPSRGEAYLDRALAALAEARPVAGPSFSEFCAERWRLSPRLPSVFAITPAAEPGMVEVLAPQTRRGAHLVVFLTGGLARDDADETPRRLLRQAHEQALLRLRAAGVTAVSVSCFEDIPSAIGEIANEASAQTAAS